MPADAAVVSLAGVGGLPAGACLHAESAASVTRATMDDRIGMIRLLLFVTWAQNISLVVHPGDERRRSVGADAIDAELCETFPVRGVVARPRNDTSSGAMNR